MVGGPFFFRLLLKFRGMLEDLGPSLLTVLEEEAGVEFYAAGDLELGGLAVLVAYL
jgi:hypothetical protein